MTGQRKPLGTLAVLALIGVLLSAVALAVEADAARGGNGNGKKIGATVATLSVTPDPVLVGSSSLTISGSGFNSNEALEVGVLGLSSVFLTTDAEGSFSTTYSPWGGFSMEGTGTAVALLHRAQDVQTLASATFSVCSTSPCQ